MYKVMIVDDELIILDKLRSIIDWRQYGCEVVAATNNSTEAFKLALNLKPDLIYSDICMPLVNGLELADLLKRELPQSLVILISGYDDFNYAQQAIEKGVFRYLLKPINLEVFIKVLKEAQQHLITLEHEIEEKERLKTQFLNSLPRLKEKFFTDLIHGALSPESFHQQLNFLELQPQAAFYGVIAIHFDNYATLMTSVSEDKYQLYNLHLLNLLQNNLKELTAFLYCFQNKPNELIVIYGVNAPQLQEQLTWEQLTPELQKAQNSIGEMYHLTFSAGLGRLYPDFSSLGISYRESLLALDFKLWAGKKVIIPYDDIVNTQSGQLLFPLDYDSFISNLREGDLAKTFLFIEKAFASFRTKEYASKNFLHLTLLNLVYQLIRSLMEFNISVEEVFGPSFDPFAKINSCDTMKDLENWLKDFARRVIEHISQHKQEVSRNFVEKAKQYIAANYAADLNLTKVAENVFVSSCYLSHLFKEITGTTIIEYLNKTRIRAAKKLLKETPLKIYEIATQVGFGDYHYFGIVFKKTTGLSPLEYRDKVQIDNAI